MSNPDLADLPARVSSDLRITVRRGAQPLTPDEALRLAQDLISKSVARRMASRPMLDVRSLSRRKTFA